MCLDGRACSAAHLFRLPRRTNLRDEGDNQLAKARGVSVNKLIDELATVALAQHDTEIRFRSLAARGSKKDGLTLLEKLDRAFGNRPPG